MKISVIIPMYNASDSIISCLDSVRNQTYTGELEIIIVNDGSKDNCLEMVNEYAKKYPSINIRIFSQENKGVSGARNFGLRESDGDYIALLDSDDEWVIDKLEVQLNYFLEYPKFSFLGGLINDPKSTVGKIILEVNLMDLIFKNYFQPSTVIFKNEVLHSIGYFDENQKYAEEGNYFLRVARKFNCGLINRKLVIYSQGKIGFGVSGLSANLIEMERGELKNLKFAYKENYISLITYLIATAFSCVKYVRRVIIVKYNVK